MSKNFENEAPNTASSDASLVNKVLAVSTAVLAAVAISLSVTTAILANKKTEVNDVLITTPMEAYPMSAGKIFNENVNICSGTKVELPNIQCVIDQIDPLKLNNTRFALGAGEQSGANVTVGYQGKLDVEGRTPYTNPYFMEGMCPVNVHWHLGTEHLSVGEYDENGKGPDADSHDGKHTRRVLAGDVDAGHKCHYYDKTEKKYTNKYNWKHCESMHVGETYEVHWPHSNMGACGTPNQYQTPFYDGVFCRYATDFPGLNGTKIGVQAQIFTIVNDEDYYYPDLIKGMIVAGEMGSDIAKYTGSTTGTSRSNEMCSQYSGVTWQVDRKCHLISASSFDKMCQDMKLQRDDMSDDLYPHGSREVVADHLAANNQVRKLRGN
mmetsp:Transcript_15743/g.15131  ORF Transcript_15743/g.15131 Transcript_15743/m.15131 type:complete len:380 (-) Transcript_15743:458-1597(-)|eukprot:CAMPEP_0197825034 /NCGR_PEP_ID=MMETSP1437-20131217/2175_1 /TAXON_ID=49252 ORGANISM="Eucampia antarctica, Strain CCMP1452" /NCGR_SAMPLE_ID=MMETSP1437 /ASSEMBLY_ACC=CAM_ASM_001096 /LENGTH=379 /DNA_ID=CAMNT_0043424873 /DNA_START=326 /DNA_END=1465 /DNA_ORIENTATION=+